MPDIQSFSITTLSSAAVSVPRATLSGQLCDSITGAVLADFTGGNTVAFPAVLATLTAAQQREVLDMLVNYLLRAKFPQFF